MFGPLDGALVLPLADGALHPQHQFLGGLSLPPQDRFRLPSEALKKNICQLKRTHQGRLNNARACITTISCHHTKKNILKFLTKNLNIFRFYTAGELSMANGGSRPIGIEHLG